MPAHLFGVTAHPGAGLSNMVGDSQGEDAAETRGVRPTALDPWVEVFFLMVCAGHQHTPDQGC